MIIIEAFIAYLGACHSCSSNRQHSPLVQFSDDFAIMCALAYTKLRVLTIEYTILKSVLQLLTTKKNSQATLNGFCISRSGWSYDRRRLLRKKNTYQQKQRHTQKSKVLSVAKMRMKSKIQMKTKCNGVHALNFNFI